MFLVCGCVCVCGVSDWNTAMTHAAHVYYTYYIQYTQEDLPKECIKSVPGKDSPGTTVPVGN